MRILIDLQGAQSASRYRGIGRYSLSLVLALIRNAGDHEIWIALNGAFQDSILEIRRQMHGLIPPERIQVFDVPVPVAENNFANKWQTRAAEKIREYFIQQLQPNAVLVTSLFEGYNDDAVTSVGEFSNDTFTAVILYDLIPLAYPSLYLQNTLQQQYYYRKLESLKKAGLLLAISDYSRQSAINMLGLLPEKIINISSSVHADFMPREISSEQVKVLYQRFNITKKIILYVPGGFDARKNVEGLFIAYSILPVKLRAEYQLVITGKIGANEEIELNKVHKRIGLEPEAVVLTGYVSEDDLVVLYNLATLVVFPSKQEGFGLPILEAMACGAPVIGSNSSSIPEAIGCEEALFDADSPQSIADKIEQVLCNEQFRIQLREHGLEQVKNFSWDKSAKHALHALEMQVENILKTTANPSFTESSQKKPRLAFVSPLPPEKTGIADYCVELLPDLMDYFAIELVTDQSQLELPASLSALPVRSVNWFAENATRYDRIIYQMGNSPFHSHMLNLLRHYPGVVNLHDFFLSGMLAYEEMFGNMPGVWANALYYSHGYSAVQARFIADGVENTKNLYPCNLEVLQNARGVIVHSKYAKQLADKWYGSNASNNWKIIPQLCATPTHLDNRFAARKALGINEQTFLVCSFGFIDPTKFSAKLLDAWLASQLQKNVDCELVLVGTNHGGDYGLQIAQRIRNSGCEARVRITGWVDKEIYKYYLQAADICVQLRGISRGETSRTVLECMSYGLATIINANGSMAELPSDSVWMLSDKFTEAELTTALEALWQDNARRNKLAERAQAIILQQHDPKICAKQYAQAIESYYQSTTPNIHDLLTQIVSLQDFPTDKDTLKYISQIIANSCVTKPQQKQLLIDVSSVMRNDLKTGIERVVRAQLLALIKNPPTDYRIEPIYFTNQNGYWYCYYARKFTCNLLNIPAFGLQDCPVDLSAGDVFYAADFAPGEIIQAAKAGLFLRWRALGVQLNVLVYDLLPILRPEFFPAGAAETHTAWLETITNFADRLIGISAAVADELHLWLKEHPVASNPLLKITSVALGADIAASAPTTGLPATAVQLLKQLQQTTTFLMVGTIEPRKGYWQALAAFEQLWSQGAQIQLVIVGKEGWKHLPASERRTIPMIIDKLSKHPELNKRLFWLQDASDEYLQEIYAACTCLLAASEGEGFGLPLIEAANYKLPIIARDLPVFREVAQQHAYYFSGLNGEALAAAITDWLNLFAANKAPSSIAMQWNTWEQNAEMLAAVLTGQVLTRSKVELKEIVLEA